MSNSCDSMDCSPPGSSAHGILQARMLEWVAISFSRGSSQPRDRTLVSCIGRQILYCWAIREAPILQLSSFIAWNSSLKGGEAESHIAYWNQKGRWESPLWQPPSRNTHLFTVAYVDTCSAIGHVHGAIFQHMVNHMGCSGTRMALLSHPELGWDDWAFVLLH